MDGTNYMDSRNFDDTATPMTRRHVYYYTHVAVRFEEAADTLAGSPARWLPSPATWDGAGWRTELRAEGALPSAVATRMVTVELGTARHPENPDGSLLLIGTTWRAVAREGWFPVFDGDIELAPLHDERCQLSLWGCYRPPVTVCWAAASPKPASAASCWTSPTCLRQLHRRREPAQPSTGGTTTMAVAEHKPPAGPLAGSQAVLRTGRRIAAMRSPTAEGLAAWATATGAGLVALMIG